MNFSSDFLKKIRDDLTAIYEKVMTGSDGIVTDELIKRLEKETVDFLMELKPWKRFFRTTAPIENCPSHPEMCLNLQCRVCFDMTVAMEVAEEVVKLEAMYGTQQSMVVATRDAEIARLRAERDAETEKWMKIGARFESYMADLNVALGGERHHTFSTALTLDRVTRNTAELKLIRASHPSSRCTCDDFCDDPCPVHERENRLQNELIEARAQLAARDAEVARVTAAYSKETKRLYQEELACLREIAERRKSERDEARDGRATANTRVSELEYDNGQLRATIDRLVDSMNKVMRQDSARVEELAAALAAAQAELDRLLPAIDEEETQTVLIGLSAWKETLATLTELRAEVERLLEVRTILCKELDERAAAALRTISRAVDMPGASMDECLERIAALRAVRDAAARVEEQDDSIGGTLLRKAMDALRVALAPATKEE